MIEGCGFSLASAIAANVSMIKLIHKSCVAEKGGVPMVAHPINSINKHEKLTVT